MKKLSGFLFTWVAAAVALPGLSAHPMGNFSVNHYSKVEVADRGVKLEYVLDLAEIPTLDLLRNWGVERDSPRVDLDRKAAEQAREWLSNLKIVSNGATIKPQFQSADVLIADGAGNLPIVRITMTARVNAPAGNLTYEDLNFPDRSGWKEIVITASHGATLTKASQTSTDLSKALTDYPPDPTLAPPQDLRAELTWTVEPQLITHRTIPTSVQQPHNAPAPSSPVTMTAQGAQPGTIVRGDFLSRLLQHKELTLSMMLLALAISFGLGGLHALTPGHGKTIVAAYLVGARGTLKHAAFLGAMVTFTHTISVFALGLATLFLFQYIVPEKITQTLGVISGLSIVAIGGWMLLKRFRSSRGSSHTHAHGEGHHHHHHHGHSHDHDHGPGGHTHIPETISLGSLVALGISGGMVPCESALVLLLSMIALGRVGLGLLLLVSFSAGLALVLTAIGIVVLYAKKLIPESRRTARRGAFQWLPVVSAAVVVMVGLIMTVVSAGWISPVFMIG